MLWSIKKKFVFVYLSSKNFIYNKLGKLLSLTTEVMLWVTIQVQLVFYSYNTCNPCYLCPLLTLSHLHGSNINKTNRAHLIFLLSWLMGITQWLSYKKQECKLRKVGWWIRIIEVKKPYSCHPLKEILG